MSTRLVEVRRKVLKQNDLLAHSLRQQFRQAGVYVASLVSSPGSGKTMFLEKLLARLAGRYAVAALVGDLATENDAARLARSTSQVRQINTGTTCHLDAQMVEKALQDWDLKALDFLFVENVGNLVCPASYDLGEDIRLVLLSTTEGEDKPLKYPTIFNTADIAILTKMDLAAAAEFDRKRPATTSRAFAQECGYLRAAVRDWRTDWRLWLHTLLVTTHHPIPNSCVNPAKSNGERWAKEE